VHELGLCSSIVDVVERRAGDRPVASVRVRVGRLHHVHPEAFEQSFAIAAMGTVADGSVAELVLVPITAACGTCTARWEAPDIPVACPGCGGLAIEIVGGDELTLESIEYKA